MNRRKAGAKAEEVAMSFLEQAGYSILKRNFTFGRIGEIDIICNHDGILVFIEVKARMNLEFGPPEASITTKKIQSIKRTAEGYLYINKISDMPCRFDVIAIEYQQDIPIIKHLINAL
ncbi:MAG: YraN family protein [Bacteroidota bacterium]|nr:YraN family protein [bacterium]NBP64960.1 YraN family protein [Bacteroidota bacterium]